MRNARSVAAVIMVALVARSGDAQTGGAARDSTSRSLSTRDSAHHDSTLRDSTIRVVVDPRSVQVISVPRPTRFQADSLVRYEVRPSGATALIGKRSGTLSNVDDRVVFTVSVPSAARAGQLPAAIVSFVTGNSDQVDVPVELIVRAQRQITLTPLANLVTLAQGGRTTIRVRIDNGGNATDTVRVSAALPLQWRSRVLEGDKCIIPPNQSAVRTFEIQAPPTSGTGAIPLAWVAVGNASEPDSQRIERARLETMLEVVARSHANGAGPEFGVSMATITGPTVPTATVFGAQMSGPVTDRVQIDARYTQQTTSGTPGLARVGAYASMPYFSLFAPTWRVNAGNAGIVLSEVAGLNTQGRGVSFDAQDMTWSISAIGAQPQFGYALTEQHGTLAAVKVGRVVDGTTLSATWSHLRDGRSNAGMLDALSLGASRRFANGTDVKAEVAQRNFFSGSGIGTLGELTHRGESGEWRLRAVRAPGGADAYALAQTDITATGAQRIGDLRLGTLAWYSDDAGRRGRYQRSRGVSVLPQWRVGTHGSVGGELRVSSSTGGDTLSSFGNTAQGASAFASGQYRAVSLSTTTTVTRNERDARLTVGTPLTSNETQLLWTTQLVLPTRAAVIDVFSGLQRAFGHDVFFAGQHELQVRVDNVSVPWLNNRARVGGALGRVAALDGSSRYVTKRVGVSALLPFDAVVRIDAEQNPMYAIGSARGGWTTVFRIERTFGAPALLSTMRSGGMVFEDANGNGTRDAGEHGIAGVVVRGAGEVAVTDRGGEYRFARRQTSDVQLDERSLPFGLMLAPRQDAPVVPSQGRTTRDIAVEPVGVIEITLTLANETYAAGTPPSLTPVSAVAIDRAGRRFMARNDDASRLVFDALPPGEYRLEVDATGTSEALTVRSELPTFSVGTKRSPARFTVLLGPRRLRLFRGAPATIEGSTQTILSDSSLSRGRKQ